MYEWCKQVLSAYEFELHAGAKTRHPNNHIYLANGKPVYSIIQELKTAPLSMIDEVIKGVAGSSVNEENFQVWKGMPFPLDVVEFCTKTQVIDNSCSSSNLVSLILKKHLC